MQRERFHLQIEEKEKEKMKKYLITGGCGFIGHHIVEHVLKSNLVDEVIVVDKLAYASMGFDRLRDIKVFDDTRVRTFTFDFTQPFPDEMIKEFGKVDYILHIGAETHVDNSILNPSLFVRSNVIGTMEVLELHRKIKAQYMLYFSTDEIFGPAPAGISYREWDRYNSTNPYSASKAGAEELCMAYANTYNMPIMVTHTMNVFGERQHPEKFIPMVIRKVNNGEVVTIHADKTRTVSGTRMYIHARNVANALSFLLEKGETRQKYNIVGEKEVSNLDMSKFIAEYLGKELKYEMVDFHSSRPGHDLRYALDGTKMANLGWTIPLTFEESLRKTIHWYLQNPRWLYNP